MSGFYSDGKWQPGAVGIASGEYADTRYSEPQVTTDNTQTLVNALAEIERLKKQALGYDISIQGYQAQVTDQAAEIERKDAALRLAMKELTTINSVSDWAGEFEHVIHRIKEALA